MFSRLPLLFILFTPLGLGAWFATFPSPTEIGTLSREAIAHENPDVLDLLEVVRTGRLPEGLDLPAFYQDPSRIGTLKQSAFSSPSPLVKQWLLLDSRTKTDILGAIIDSQDIVWMFAFLGELAYAGIALEPDPGISSQIRLAVLATGVHHAQAAIFLLDHIAQVCPHDTVRGLASRDAEDFRARVGALGR